MTTQLKLSQIRIDGGTQSRVSINEQTVSDYADLIAEGVALPDVVAFFDGADTWLADGFHRFHAHAKLGVISINVDIRQGMLTDAKLYAYAANQSHGLPRTNNDKRKAVSGMLADFSDWSNRAISKHIGVSDKFVASIRDPQVAEKQKANREATNAKQVAGCDPIAPKLPECSPAKPAPFVEKQDAGIESDQDQELAEAHHTIGELALEVEQLRDKLAVEGMDASEESKTEAADIIADLRIQLKNLEREIDAMRLSRDSFQRENAEMKKQIVSLNRQLKKIEA